AARDHPIVHRDRRRRHDSTLPRYRAGRRKLHRFSIGEERAAAIRLVLRLCAHAIPVPPVAHALGTTADHRDRTDAPHTGTEHAAHLPLPVPTAPTVCNAPDRRIISSARAPALPAPLASPVVPTALQKRSTDARPKPSTSSIGAHNFRSRN